MVAPIIVLLGLLLLLGQGWSYDSGYYTPEATTAWWTPTPTSYVSYWTPSTTYTTCYTQQNVVVTITSILPCPATSTTVYYECCDQCENNCSNPPTYIGTTTVTSYTTTTPLPQQTITSNGLVIVLVDSTAYSSPTLTPSVVYQFSSDAQDASSNFWSAGMFLALIATIMILL
ncbi:uncharacterized protein Z518_05456 [Rhinocladiella mackenziei CBS 650.93]|uniref:Uncharacterized protein n=1 Tax=Rhinocladiella mackenziei CBS 650.93 TaxID=1442369 RepID=A0A0D2IN85_9EURO|nr:uncharacterized protein Z518_05456 [Rhinocladiella mackenziei CBS 650.93]KIX04586.1 hypothetical protein Z518_05456 [Rhinocladiella mackenziei CBS 650.93]